MRLFSLLIVMFVYVGSALFFIGLLALIAGKVSPMLSVIILTALLFSVIASPIFLTKSSK